MTKWVLGALLLLVTSAPPSASARGGLARSMDASTPTAPAAQQSGSIRGVLYDDDFDAPLAGAEVQVAETGQRTTSAEQGSFALQDVLPGVYTLVVWKEGYVRQVRSGVVVQAGRLTELEVRLALDVTDMEEFVVQDTLRLDAGSEAALLELRFESPALLDAIGADLIGKSGASDAASALNLVAGASTQDGKSAVVRGLPDRYVSSQLNGVRLPTADEDKRAVELDQFPAVVIESIQVAKTFTPDQQGDASGGAVDVRLKGVPQEPIFELRTQVGFNSRVRGSDFLTYRGGGVSGLGDDADSRGPQLDQLGQSWDGAVGTTIGDEPLDWKASTAIGGRTALLDGVDVGGFLSLFYERDSSYYDDGRDDSLWVDDPGGPLVPQTEQGAPDPLGLGDYRTALFDVTRATESVQWGGLASLGLEGERNRLGLTYLYTRTAEDAATLAEDTRGKAFFFPGFDPDDNQGPGNAPEEVDAAPYVRTQTLQYTERTADSLQLSGFHELPWDGWSVAGLEFREPKLDWVLSRSTAKADQPDKRQFGVAWKAESFDPGVPPFRPPSTDPAVYVPYKPSANVNLGNLQRIFKVIEEESSQVSVNATFPFDQWDGEEGFLKAGWFADRVDRTFDQDTYSNFNDSSSYEADFDEFWSDVFPHQNHPITESEYDVDYDGELDVTAWYGMLKLPVSETWSVVGGARFERTEIEVVNTPEEDAQWFPIGATAPVSLDSDSAAADVDFSQDDVLPSLGVVYEPSRKLTLRASWSRTVARQTFKELTPILQQEFLGGPIFIGNPELGMSSLDNYDLRVDYEPHEGGLLSASWFHKDIEDPIEYVQRLAGFDFTTAVNYPSGTLSGYELEARQRLGTWWDPLEGFTVGANATLIDAEVELSPEERQDFDDLLVPMKTRDMTNAPEHLYNLFATWEHPDLGTELAAFYTVQGDTLIAGAGESTGNFVPSVYLEEVGTLNVSLSQRLWKHVTLKLQAKNLTDPAIEEVYRSKYLPGGDVTRSSYHKGVDYSIQLGISL